MNAGLLENYTWHINVGGIFTTKWICREYAEVCNNCGITSIKFAQIKKIGKKKIARAAAWRISSDNNNYVLGIRQKLQKLSLNRHT